jgi:hypothetical protein
MVYAHFASKEAGYAAMKKEIGRKGGRYDGLNAEEIGVTWMGAAPKGGFKGNMLDRAKETLFGRPQGNSAGERSSNASLDTSGGTLRTGAGFNQLSLDANGKLITSAGADVKKATDGTLTAVSNEDDTQGKILNILEQTYNLHAETKAKARFSGFTRATY